MYDDGRHVDKEYKDQRYRLVYDNKRRILDENPVLNPSTKLKLYDSIP